MAVATADSPRPAIPAWARTWVLERGILYAMIQTPLLALLAGFFYRVAPYRFMLLPLLASFVALPIWISYRQRVSTNPDEPVHHLHKYALWALVGAGFFTVVRIPLVYTMGVAFWTPWYDFGNALTGTALGRPETLLAGSVVNALQGWSVGMGFYILFKRHSLLNALLYVGVWVTSLYSFDMPTYSRVGQSSPASWHAIMAAGHSSLALALWFLPQFSRLGWPRLTIGLRAVAVGVGALIVITPGAFAEWRAATWEAPLETRIDQAAFSRPALVSLKDGPSLLSTGADATYGFTLRFGPRDYDNWFKQLRALDATSVRVSGRLWQGGEIIAWCQASTANLPSPNGIASPEAFPPAMRAMRFTDIPVSCTGPAAAAQGIGAGSRVTVEWTAEVSLVGGRLQETRQFNGNEAVPLRFTTPGG
jgi:hypothetical protein